MSLCALPLSCTSYSRQCPCAQSCPESPIGRRPDLPYSKDGATTAKDRRWSTKKLLKPLLGPLAKKEISITPEDVLTLGVNQLFRSSTREKDDDNSNAGPSTRNRSKERADSVSGSDSEFGAPLARTTSDQTGICGSKKQKKGKSSFLASLTGSSAQQQQQQDGALWRTQSATTDLRRSKSRESQAAVSEAAKRPRSSSSAAVGGAQAQPRARRQLKMLNGRVYGAKRNNLNGVNLFATARCVMHSYHHI